MNQLVKTVKTPLTQGEQYQKLMKLAITSDGGIEKLEKLMVLQERWEAKEAKKAYVLALSEFQAQCPVIIKKKPGHNYKYAPMCDVVSQVGQLLANCGLSYRFEQEHKNNLIAVTCIASHVDGHSEMLRMEAEDDTSGSKNAVQAKGSTVTYLSRYTFLGSFGIATADEDMDGRLAGMNGDCLLDDQVANLEALLDEVKADRVRFLKFFKVVKVEDILNAQYNRAIKMLESKR